MKHENFITRREMLGVMTTAVFASSRLQAQAQAQAQAPAPEFGGLDHIEFYVSNVEKSRDFYVRIFSRTLKNRGAKRYLKLGSAYMAFEPPRGNGAEIRVDHFSTAIRKLDMAKLHSLLDARGVAYQDYPSGRDTGVNDPDAIRLQLSPEDGWSLLNPASFPDEAAPIQDDPIFRPTGLDHILLNVADPEKSAAFYQKVFGPPSQRNNNRIWFQVGTSRIGLLQTPAGQRPGVNHFCVSAATYNYDAAVRRLQQIGAKVENPEVAGAAEFRDPDGLLVQVMGPR
jgi:catechol 2,3-dioxygenase-like lactoylglutathione lyase family enzyme